MGRTYDKAIRFLNQGIDPDTIFVEIGSERGEGSTMYLANLAAAHNTVLHTVDISDAASKSLSHPALVCHVAPGLAWINDTLPKINKQISLLYLDNFDWIWNINAIEPYIAEQITMYKIKFGVDMSNDACQQEHFNQMMALMPHMAERCLVLLDDTYLINGAWSGKGGPIVPALRYLGFTILEWTPQKEVVMGRGY